MAGGSHSDHASVDHPTVFTYNDSLSNHASTPNHNPVNTSILYDQSNEVNPGFSVQSVNEALRLQLEGSGLLDSHNLSDGHPTSGRVFFATTLFPIPSDAPPVNSSSATSIHGAMDDDDIVAESILTAAPPTQQEPLRSRNPSQRPFLFFDCGHHSPVLVHAASAPAPAPGQRVFSIPIPTFDIPPTIPLPPSADNSRVHISHLDEKMNRRVSGIRHRIGHWSPSPRLLPFGAHLNYSSSSIFNRGTSVSPLRIHHSRVVTSHTPDWAHAGHFDTASHSHSAFGSGSFDLQASTSSGPPNKNMLPMTSTPWSHSRAPFPSGYDDSNVQDANNTGVEPYHGSFTEYLASDVLQYPPEEPMPEHGFPPLTSQTHNNFSYNLNPTRSGILSPHPTGYLRRLGSSDWTDGFPGAIPPYVDGLAYLHGVEFAPVEQSATLYDLESTLSSAESSTSDDDVIVNHREESPFGPAIDPEPFQNAFPSNDTSEPARPVRVLPFVGAHDARSGTVSPILTEADTSGERSMPSTPSPPSRIARAPFAVEGAYSLRTTFPPFSSFANPENTLPPMGYPEDPKQVTLPSFAQVVEGLNMGGVLAHAAEVSEATDTTQRGDEEDESNSEYEEELMDGEHTPLPQPSGSQSLVFVNYGPDSSLFAAYT
ncbi:unnamed protein product [Rhizoctonia solani]|uniref:Uncharacterized protein n=1 Tax=Rhizoctonia solani TaxID=456999 RepID=A0A8H3I0G0_9AGAM|nr:unnamed protein product [Rhizoctonia solani]